MRDGDGLPAPGTRPGGRSTRTKARHRRGVCVDPRVEQVRGAADDEVAQLVEHEVELTAPEPQRGVWNGSLRLKTASRSLANAWSRPDAAPRARWRGYAGALALVAASTGAAALMQSRFDLSNLSMVYLVGVVLSAIAFGRRAAMLAALLSVAAFDFLFVPPRYTLRVSDTQYLVTLGVMLFVAAVIGTLTAWLRG